MKKVMLMLLASFVISCCGLRICWSTNLCQVSKATKRKHTGGHTTRHSVMAVREEHFKQRIRQQQRQIEKLQTTLRTKEQLLDRLLIKSRRSDSVHQPATVDNEDDAEGMILYYDKADGFRAEDRVVFVRRTKQGIRLMGQGKIFKAGMRSAYDHQFVAQFVPLDFENLGIRPMDEVYVSNRGDSIYSLALLRF